MYSDNFDLGLDIGTNSTGWAVVNKDGSLPKFKGKRMWGSIISFQDSTGINKNAQRRAFRSTRRRLARKKQRVLWVQELMASMVYKADKDFFKKLKYSYLSEKDDSFDYLNPIHIDRGGYKSAFYMNDYPTVFHLRKSLIEKNEKADIRLIYLAFHHIVANRGNFLYEGQNINLHNLDISNDLKDFLENFLFDDFISYEDIIEIMDSDIRTLDKKRNIAAYLQSHILEDVDQAKNYCSSLAGLILGYTENLKYVFGLESDLKIALSNEDADYSSLNDEALFAMDLAKKVYSGFVLKSIVKGDNIKTISDCYINRYNSHAKDLQALKKLIRKYFDTTEPDNVYVTLINSKNPDIVSYENYIKHPGKNNLDKFYDAIKKQVLNKIKDTAENDEDYIYCSTRIENGEFLLKPRNNQNGAIPYQLHLEEMEAIIEAQGKYYPELLSIKDKLTSICSFRIPYFVGPLQKYVYKNGVKEKNEFAWIEKRTEEKIRPWNFKEVVDFNKSEEAFIRRMTNKCSELHSEDVLPRQSLLYQEYCVLDELSHIKIDGRRLEPSIKLRILKDLFAKQKSVSKKVFIDWLYSNNCIESKKVEVTGLSDPAKFINSLSSYIDFERILGNSFDVDMIEKIILFITISSSKLRIQERLAEDYPSLSEDQIKQISNIRCKGWGRLSKKLLSGLFYTPENGIPLSIIDIMRTTNKNYMEIKFDSKYGFAEKINKFNEKNLKAIVDINEFIDNYPTPPSVRKMARVTIKAIKDIQKAMNGQLPSAIYLENSSSVGEKGARTVNRYYKLKKMFEDITNNDEYLEVMKELEGYKDNFKALDERKLLLYFMQNGKCLYTRKPLKINDLSSYQIDHIIPQSLIKDNSIHNVALVISEKNQRKSNELTLSSEIIDNQKDWWKTLVDSKLMTKEKFASLTRSEFSDDDVAKFINRQLVETQQTIQLVKDLIKYTYPEIEVFGTSARLSSNIRSQYGLTKVRELNDYHHAEDAYLAARVGYFVQKRFSITNTEERKEYSRIIKEDPNANKYGLIAGLFSKTLPGWFGYEELKKIKSDMNSLDHFINYLTEEMTDEFYNQTKQPKGAAKLVPLSKEKNRIDLYGGYTNDNNSYYKIIRIPKGKKSVLKIVGIPIRIACLGDDALPAYIVDTYGEKAEIAYPVKIPKYQAIMVDNDNGKKSELLMTSAGEVINARQLVLKDSYLRTVKAIYKGKVFKDDYINDCIKIDELYNELISKLSFYYCYDKIYSKLISKESEYKQLIMEDKVKLIKALITIMKADAKRIEGKNWPISDIPSSRMIKTIDLDKTTFIYRSITGLFEASKKYGI